MTERGSQLFATADSQISALIGVLSARGEAALSLACPGREKLGDGTVAACALHTADRYQQIAGFLQTTTQMADPHGGGGAGRSANSTDLPAPGEAHGGHAAGAHDEHTHAGNYTAQKVDLHALLEPLSSARETLSLLADLTDERLDVVPPTGSFRFCDGQRTLEQVVASLLKHQAHQVDAIKAAVA